MASEQNRESNGSQESVILSLTIVSMALIILFNFYRIDTLQSRVSELEEDIRVLHKGVQIK